MESRFDNEHAVIRVRFLNKRNPKVASSILARGIMSVFLCAQERRGRGGRFRTVRAYCERAGTGWLLSSRDAPSPFLSSVSLCLPTLTHRHTGPAATACLGGLLSQVGLWAETCGRRKLEARSNTDDSNPLPSLFVCYFFTPNLPPPPLTRILLDVNLVSAQL